MSNMSYCRFRNTLSDLEDCKDALEAMMTESNAAIDLPEEMHAAKELVKTCAEILMLVAENTAIDDDEILDAALDSQRVDRALDKLNEASAVAEEEEDA